jgi:hypothetical protein
MDLDCAVTPDAAKGELSRAHADDARRFWETTSS